MTNFFSLPRFSKLFRKHTAEHFRGYLISLVVLMGIMIIFISYHNFVVRRSMDLNTQADMFSVILLISGALFTSSMFADLGEPRSAINMLMLPASHFEKFVVRWLYSYIIFLFMFTGCYYIVLTILLSIGTQSGSSRQIINIFTWPENLYIFAFFSIIHSFTLFGSVFFKKMHFIKTAFAGILALVLFVTVNKVMLERMLGILEVSSFPFVNTTIAVDKRQYYTSLDIPSNDPTIIPGLIAIIITVLLWAAAYFRLKEKQV